MNTRTTLSTFAVALVAALSITSGCSKNKPKAKTPTSDSTAGADGTPAKPAPDVTKDQAVSPSLAVSADIAAACGIVAPKSSTPKFDYDKDELTADDRAVLEQIATCLTTGALKGRSVDLIGRADPRGTEEYNLGLGSRRAQTVSQYLQRLGVGQPQMGVTTRGALEATGTDEAGWAQDRRVDVQLAN